MSPMERLVRGLECPDAYPHPVGEITHIETHISHVLLTGEFVYKLKKPVNLGFVDYTTLARRKHFCEEELRLNGRLAPQLYLGVEPIGGTPDRPTVGGAGEPIEDAVKMRAFRQEDQWDRALRDGRLTAAHVVQLADQLAAFHQQVVRISPGCGLGGSAQVAEAVRANFELTRPFVGRWMDPVVHSRLEEWSGATLKRLAAVIEGRLEAGFVRECHGDAHLQNVAFVAGGIALFDGIEFNDRFRFIDVMAEIAFTCMDLDSRGRPDLGARFLNGYLEVSGDYEGVSLLPLYLSYRAMVRAKVACLSPDSGEQGERVAGLLALADGYTRSGSAALILMHGVTGCGKSTVSTGLLARLGAIRIRSDVERKRLAGVEADCAVAAPDTDLYAADMTQRTYARLLALADTGLASGWPMMLDATYLSRTARSAAKELARRRGVPCIIVSCHASDAELARRIRARSERGDDVSDGTLEVLALQLKHADPLTEAEVAMSVLVDTESLDEDALADQVARLAEKLGATDFQGRRAVA